jgi:hypothetical protein
MVLVNSVGVPQEVARKPKEQDRALRICMPTARRITKKAYQCSLYEAQDVLAGLEGADLLHLEPEPRFRWQFPWHKRLTYHDFSGQLIFQNPGLRKTTLTQDYDVFIAVCQSHGELLYLNAIKGWEDHCKTSICWLDEMWAAYVPVMKHWLPALRRFDYIFIGNTGSIALLSDMLGKQVYYAPGAADTLRFSPFPQPSERVIDVYSIGRRSEGIHHALLEASASPDFFYIYDTLPGIADMEPYDHQRHRDFVANMAKRSRYFLVAPGKVNLPGETLGQSELGHRYFEGASAGAVMLGQVPESAAFAELFPWPDAVVPIRTDGSDTMQTIAALNADPQRLRAISRKNAIEALLHHDWIHRWKEILRRADLPPTPEMSARELRLRELANAAMQAN